MSFSFMLMQDIFWKAHKVNIYIYIYIYVYIYVYAYTTLRSFFKVDAIKKNKKILNTNEL